MQDKTLTEVKINVLGWPRCLQMESAFLSPTAYLFVDDRTSYDFPVIARLRHDPSNVKIGWSLDFVCLGLGSLPNTLFLDAVGKYNEEVGNEVEDLTAFQLTFSLAIACFATIFQNIHSKLNIIVQYTENTRNIFVFLLESNIVSSLISALIELIYDPWN